MAPPTIKPLYFEKLPHWPTLIILDFSWNIVRKLFAKVLGREISCLTAWRVPEFLGWPKTSEYDQITWLYVLIKTLNKKCQGKKLIYKPRISIQKENLKSKPKKNRLEKGLFFGPSWPPPPFSFVKYPRPLRVKTGYCNGSTFLKIPNYFKPILFMLEVGSPVKKQWKHRFCLFLA